MASGPEYILAQSRMIVRFAKEYELDSKEVIGTYATTLAKDFELLWDQNAEKGENHRLSVEQIVDIFYQNYMPRLLKKE